MGKTSTLIYIFNNFDESEIIYDWEETNNEKEFSHIWTFIDENIKKVPDQIVDNIMDFVKDS